MPKISDATIDAVRRVPILDIAERMGHHPKRVGASYQIFCPNPNHAEKTPDTYIKTSVGENGVFACFGGGGCGCKGGDALRFFAWANYGGWDPKRHFVDSVIGVANVMGITVLYEGDFKPKNGQTRKPAPAIEPNKVFSHSRIEVEASDPDTCDRVYRKLLELCPVYQEHAQEWLGPKRQYTKEQVLALGLRSVPKTFDEFFTIIRKLQDSGEDLSGIPGFTMRLKKGGNSFRPEDYYWTIAVTRGYFIPVRDELGRIIRLRVATGGTPKYIWFSSNPNVVTKGSELVSLDPYLDLEKDAAQIRMGGAPSGAPVNVVVPHKLLRYWEPGTPIEHLCDMAEVIGTEGEHKSNICANRLMKPVIGVPGVGNYQSVIPILKQWGTTKFNVAYDMDSLKKVESVSGRNDEVFKHLTHFSQLLLQENIGATVWTWNVDDGKGLDDLILNHKLPMEVDLRTRARREVVIA